MDSLQTDEDKVKILTFWAEKLDHETSGALWSVAARMQDLIQWKLEAKKALAFAESVIKSGDTWTPTCETIIGAILHKDNKKEIS